MADDFFKPQNLAGWLIERLEVATTKQAGNLTLGKQEVLYEPPLFMDPRARSFNCQIQEGDKLWTFDSGPVLRIGAMRHGRSGVALVREGEVIECYEEITYWT